MLDDPKKEAPGAAFPMRLIRIVAFQRLTGDWRIGAVLASISQGLGS